MVSEMQATVDKDSLVGAVKVADADMDDARRNLASVVARYEYLRRKAVQCLIAQHLHERLLVDDRAIDRVRRRRALTSEFRTFPRLH